MPRHEFLHPQPSPVEREVLEILIEECGEVIQRATKMIRFGIEEVQPGQLLSNRRRLSDEVGDLEYMIALAKRLELVDDHHCIRAAMAKPLKLREYMRHVQDLPDDFL